LKESRPAAQIGCREIEDWPARTRGEIGIENRLQDWEARGQISIFSPLGAPGEKIEI
jgi:hypothetical protein